MDNGSANNVTRVFDALGRMDSETNALGAFDWCGLAEARAGRRQAREAFAVVVEALLSWLKRYLASPL